MSNIISLKQFDLTEAIPDGYEFGLDIQCIAKDIDDVEYILNKILYEAKFIKDIEELRNE